MSTINELNKRLNTDKELRVKIDEILAQELTPEQGVEAIAALGYTITTEEWVRSTTKEEVAPDELEAVAGGLGNQTRDDVVVNIIVSPPYPKW